MIAIAIADRVRPGQDAAGVHQSMLDDIAREAGRAGWKGVAFTNYRHDRRSGATLIEAEAGPGTVTLEALKTWNKRRRGR